MSMRVGLGILLVLANGAHCASSRFDGHVVTKSDVVYQIGVLGPDWTRFEIDSGDVAFRHRDGGVIFANAMCQDLEDVPLGVLANHLLFGVESKVEKERETLTLDGRAALSTTLVGTLDGVEVSLRLVVLKKDGCTFDLHLIAGAERFAAHQPDFARFVLGFAKRDKH